MIDYITDAQRCQYRSNMDKYAERKRAAMIVGALYWRTPMDNIGDAIYHCGDNMIIRTYESGDVDTAYSIYCGNRLCPICAHRRSIKLYAMLSDVMDYIDKQRISRSGAPYSYIMITLTVRNCNDLSSALDDMQDAYIRLIRSKAWQVAVKGAYRSTEITINPETLQYHPHYHILCAVNPSYYSSKQYISQDKLTQLWQRSLRSDYQPICNIIRCYSKQGSDAKREASKYIVKTLEPLQDIPADDAAIMLADLHMALRNRKLRMAYGVMRQAQGAIGISDNEIDHIADDMDEDALLSKLRPEMDYIYQLMQYNSAQGAYMALPHIRWDSSASPYMQQYIAKYNSLMSEQAVVMGDNDAPTAKYVLAASLQDSAD